MENNTKPWPDDKVIEQIQHGGDSRDQALYHIYVQQNWKNLVVHHALMNQGTKEDGDDLAQNAIIAFDRNIRLHKFKGKSTLKTYFLSIAKFLWLKKIRDNKPSLELKSSHYEKSDNSSVEDHYFHEKQKQALEELLDQVGSRCKQILKLWQLDYPMDEIAEEVGLSSAAMAKKEAFRCRKRIRKFLNNNPSWLEKFR